jgi:glycosyltransferase involved in cell wall biosynthesis
MGITPKRVAFIINRMNYRPSSGHGIFMKGVVETLLNNGHFIDIICDGEPEENFLSNFGINVYYPSKDERLTYGKHSNLFQFADSFNFEKSINFRTAIVKAMTNHLYDLVICNDTESAFVCYQLELYKHMRIASYAHECASINPELGAGVFKDCYYNLIDKMMFWPEMVTLIQTNQNKNKLMEKFEHISSDLNAVVQLYPLTDSMDFNILEKDGLLFIGRHEDRKNPGEYIKVLKAIKDKFGVEVKAKIMTRTAHVKKWEADLSEIGHTNYEIVSDVVGEAKARFIQSAKVAFMPYKNESFGIAVLEALRWMPTVVLDKYDWHYNFESFSNYIVADTKEAADIIWSAYNTWTVDFDKVNAEFAEYQTNYETSLLEQVNVNYIKETKTEPRNRLYSTLKESKGEWHSLEEYFLKENSKGVIYLTSDIEAMYTNRKWYSTLHTNSTTYLGIPDEKGNISHTEKPVETKDNEAFSSFFQ